MRLLQTGVSSVAFSDLANSALDKFLRWARRKHCRIKVKIIRRRYTRGGWWPAIPAIGLFNPDKVDTHALPLTGNHHPHPMASRGMNRSHKCATGLVNNPVPGRPAPRVREATRGNPPVEIPAKRPESLTPNLLIARLASRCPCGVVRVVVWMTR